MSPPPSLEIEVTPGCPYRLSTRGRADGVMRSSGGVLTRLLHVDGEAVVVHCLQRRGGAVAIRAVAVEDECDAGILEQAQPTRSHRGLDTVRDAELVEDVCDVHAGRLATDEEGLADLAVRAAVGNEPEDLDLAGREPGRPALALRRELGWLGSVHRHARAAGEGLDRPIQRQCAERGCVVRRVTEERSHIGLDPVATEDRFG